jgi:hypothetical protein
MLGGLGLHVGNSAADHLSRPPRLAEAIRHLHLIGEFGTFLMCVTFDDMCVYNTRKLTAVRPTSVAGAIFRTSASLNSHRDENLIWAPI